MRIIIDNLGVIRHAKMDIKDITIICGKNNTGKTYATYAYYGFLDFFNNGLTNSISDVIDLKKIDITPLKDKGILSIDVKDYLDNYPSLLQKICQIYSKKINRVFVSNASRFKDTKFEIQINDVKIAKILKIKLKFADRIQIETRPSENTIIITKIKDDDKISFPEYILKNLIGHFILRSIFQSVFQQTYFIASVERTGASIFKKELYLNRNRIVEQLSESSSKKDIDLRDVLFNSYSPYPLPVKDNVTFIQELSLLGEESPLSESHPEILTEFSKIVGGKYSLDKEGEVTFIPSSKIHRQAKLQLTESSSVVRALIHLDYYLRYKARVGDLLIVDEPELNLHPENQRKIARLFARIANAGIKVFITTHSDYIVKELSTLIMFSQKTDETEAIRTKYGYFEDEIIDKDKICVYIAENEKINGKKRSKEYNTLTPAPISQEYGIELKTFDEVINTMNEIQDSLIWRE